MAELLAKPDVSLKKHLYEVASLASQLANRLKFPESLKKRCILAGLFHDLGKATSGFQKYMHLLAQGRETEARKLKSRVFPHALASLPFVLVAEKELLGEPLLATGAVLSHHSPLSGDLYRTWEGKPDYAEDIEEILCWLTQQLENLFPDSSALRENLKIALEFKPLSLLECKKEEKDRRVSLRGILQGLPKEDFAKVKAVLCLADWMASAGGRDPKELFLENPRAKVENYFKAFKYTPRKFQREAGKHSGKSLALRAPTGSGKTEALLLWAGEAERIIYLLPTQATTNAMYERLKEIFGAGKVGLAHGHASYILHQENETDFLWEKLSSLVFAKPVTVATLDQFLMACLHGRHWEERLTLAASANLIFDEIHLYEPYTLGLLKEALNNFSSRQWAFASATFPKAIRKIFPTEVFLEAEEELFRRRRHRLRLEESSLTEAIKEIVSKAQRGQRVLVIFNTVREAQSFYRQLIDKYCSEKVKLFHSRFTFGDRISKEKAVKDLEKTKGSILIATQVVEVSLDISYDVLFSELSPLDALVQRLGRVNRRGESPPAETVIFTRVSEGSRRIYSPGILNKSVTLLKNLPEVPEEKDWVEAVDNLYEGVEETEDFRSEFEEGRRILNEVQKILGCYTIDLTDEEMRARFTTRRGTPSVEVLPEKFYSRAVEFKEKGEGWRLVEFLVPVPIWWFYAYEDYFPPRDPELGVIVTQLPYSSELGLSEPEEDELLKGCML